MDDVRGMVRINRVENVPGRNDIVAFKRLPDQTPDLCLVEDNDVGVADLVLPGPGLGQVEVKDAHIGLVRLEDRNIVLVLVDADDVRVASLVQT